MSDDIKVSVCVLAYNHEKYIDQCLSSIVNQECDFKFEILIGEDCSTDQTKKIIEKYEKEYPELIKASYNQVNIGGDKNYYNVHDRAQGKYICIIDGDDYALPGKLQHQSNFMDKTPDCNISFHRVKILLKDGTLVDDLVDFNAIKMGFRRKDLLLYSPVATHSSKMYRRELRNFERPDFPPLDMYMHVEQVQDNKAYFIDGNIYGVYRASVGISTESKNFIKELIIKMSDTFLKKYPQYKAEINSAYLVALYIDLKCRRSFKNNLFKVLKTFSFRGIYITVKTWEIRKMLVIHTSKR